MNRKERRAKGEKKKTRDESLLDLALDGARKMYRADPPIDMRDIVFLFLDVGDPYAMYIAASVTSRLRGTDFDSAAAELERDHEAAIAKGRRAVLGFWANGSQLAEILMPDLGDSREDMQAALLTPDDRAIRICAIADGTVSFTKCALPYG